MSIILKTPNFLAKYLPSNVYIARGGDNGQVLAEYKHNRKSIVLYREFFNLTKSQQKFVLYHECGHALRLVHNENCLLMQTYLPAIILQDNCYERILREAIK